MSDETATPVATQPAAPAPAPAPSGDIAALATMKAVADDVVALKRDVKRLWVVTLTTIAVVVLIGAGSIVPRLLGGRMMGGPAGFRPGMQQGQQFQGGPGQGQQFRGGPGQGQQAPGGTSAPQGNQ